MTEDKLPAINRGSPAQTDRKTSSSLSSLLSLPVLRPMPYLLFALMGGILAGHHQTFPLLGHDLIPPLLAAVAIMQLLALSWTRKCTRLKTVLSLVLFALLGLTTIRAHAPQLPCPPVLAPFFDRPETLYLGEVMQAADIRMDRVRIPVRLHAAILGDRTVPLEGGVLITMPPSSGGRIPLHGEIILARLTLKRFHNFNNPGGYDYVRAQAVRGLHARAHVTDHRWTLPLNPHTPLLPHDPAGGLKQMVNRVRIGYLHFIQSTLPGDTGALYAALLLGYRNLTSRELQEAITSSGVAHLLAISGLHLGLVAMSVFWASRWLLRILVPSWLTWCADKHLALWPALVATIFYACISGLALPTWRALVAVFLLFLAALHYRKEDFLSTLSAAAIIILTVSPHSLRQPSFQLSFAAVAGIVLIGKALPAVHTQLEGSHPRTHLFAFRVVKPFWTAFWVSLAANVTVLPIVAFHFHGISLVGFLTNTLLVPLVGMAALPIGFTACLIHPLSGLPGELVLRLGGCALDLARAIILYSVQWDWSYFYVGELSTVWLAVYYAALSVVILPWPLVRKLIGLCALSTFTVLFSFTPFSLQSPEPKGHLRATIIDVGQGSSTLLEFPAGETMLVDGGGFWDGSFDVGRQVVAPFLWHRKIKNLDYVVLSHDHPDHKGGLRFILSRFKVGEFWESGIHAAGRHRGDLESIALRRNVRVRKLEDLSGSFRVGPVEVVLIHPTRTYLDQVWDGRDLNNVSLVLEIRHGRTSLLLPGDIDRSVESLLPLEAHGRDPVQWLLVAPHHGSDTSSGEEWLKALKPQAIIFSCGVDNLFGFPSEQVLQRCRSLGIPHHRTDRGGAIQATSNGQRWFVTETVSGGDGN